MALGAVGFGWFVKRAILIEDDSLLGKAAIGIASFPTDVKKVVKEIGRTASGQPDDSPIRAHPPSPLPSDLVPVQSALTGVGEGLLMRRGPAVPARGWRVIAGVLQINGALQTSAVLLSPDLRIVHHWPLVEDAAIDAEYKPALRKVPHGLSLLSDGSVIYSLDNGSSLHRKDKCGGTIWALPGHYHHAVTLDDTEATAWVLREEPWAVPGQYGQTRDDTEAMAWAVRQEARVLREDARSDLAAGMRFVQVATADGKILREFSIADIIAANPQIDILELRLRHPQDEGGNAGGLAGRWLLDPIHLNDVDPLPQRLADKFPMFAAGDLLVSAREINLLFVIDPATLKIKWWEVGATIRQHDPDWTADGSLHVFNNRMGREHSDIKRIDPATRAMAVAVDGKALDFYSRRRGSHQPLPGGGELIASTQQGRIIEVSADGQVALEFYNRVPGERPLHTILSIAAFLPEGAFNRGDFQCGN
jgi:Arylsulfotransferase (ASST)